MQLKEVMTKGAKTVRPDATLIDVAKIMLENDIGALPVVQDQQLAGVITDRDITVRATAKGLDPGNTRVADVMTREVCSCPAGSDVNEAIQLMEDRQIRRVVVSDTNNRPIGIVSLGDLALHLRNDQLAGEALKEVSKPKA